jgi:hypothetical protein
VTPKNYIEGVELFKDKLDKVRNKEKAKLHNLNTGLGKMR